jgi:hypothetical protein
MPKINLKGNLENDEFKKFEELRKRAGSQIGVLRFLLKERMYGATLTYEDKNKLIAEIEKLKAEINSINDRLNTIISILTFGK